jgi:hypothetical protein
MFRLIASIIARGISKGVYKVCSIIRVITGGK